MIKLYFIEFTNNKNIKVMFMREHRIIEVIKILWIDKLYAKNKVLK